jgi:membrane-associated phospholipid phosphatase
MPKPTRLGQRAVRALLALAVLGLGGTALAANFPKGEKSGPFAGQPMPRLFASSDLPLIDQLTAAPQARAGRDFARWIATHPARDDTAFAAFALTTVGRPPAGTAQPRELAALHRIDAQRTPVGVTAATWLEAHGKKDVWKLYLKQYQPFVTRPAAKHAKAIFKATYKLAKTIAAEGKTRFARPSPYITDPTLHALNQTRFTKKYSYPAKHALLSFALSAVLAHDEPARSGEYRWMADEISYSRLYAGGHYPSDIAAGAYLGTLVGLYELHFAATAANTSA